MDGCYCRDHPSPRSAGKTFGVADVANGAVARIEQLVDTDLVANPSVDIRVGEGVGAVHGRKAFRKRTDLFLGRFGSRKSDARGSAFAPAGT